jgi:urea transport system permease protein
VRLGSAILIEGLLQVRESDGAVFIIRGSGASVELLDPVSLESAGTVAESELRKVKIKNSIRRQIADAVSGLTLRAKDPAVRLEAAATLFSRPDPDMIETLDAVIAEESNSSVRAGFEAARAAAVLESDLPEEQIIAAITVLRDRGGRDVLPVLTAASRNTESEAIAAAAANAVETVEQNIWYGLSLGSVLLLAAIGLAITFGVMGVINMAHGEMVMLGAYTTFVVQEVIRTSRPGCSTIRCSSRCRSPSWSPARSACHRTRHHPLPLRPPAGNLLATWGVSLILQQAVRTIFGPTNREVGNPVLDVGFLRDRRVAITYNRLWIVVFRWSSSPILLLWCSSARHSACRCARSPRTGMASSMGIRTPGSTR